ncbi:MAG: gliding motility-associated C-terminal domain-containing protein [Bacteroidia bacterium]|nr:gliding motility-associated C-terminal domain-containing protein [Bacteroidia bacterium]
MNWIITIFYITILSLCGTINVRAQANYTVQLPSIFTPNGDGINDSLYVTTSNIKEFTWSIYNRYGRIIIELNNLQPKWNGNNTIGDQPTDEGFYYYTFNAITNTNEAVSRHGWLFIIR